MKIQKQSESFSWRLGNDNIRVGPGLDPVDRYHGLLETYHEALSGAGINSQSLYGQPVGKAGYKYSPERENKRELIRQLMWNTGGTENPHLAGSGGIKSVPQEGLSLIMAGQAGSGKGTVINHPEMKKVLNAQNHYTSNPDPLKPVGAYLGLVPSQEELNKALSARGYSDEFISQFPKFTNMDLSPLIHGEMSDINNEILTKAFAGGHNIAFDGTFSNAKVGLSTLGQLSKHGYQPPTGLLVDSPMSYSLPRAEARYNSAHKRTMSGANEEGWDEKGHPAFIKELRRLTSEFGLDGELNKMWGQHFYMPGQGGRYVPKFVSKSNEATEPGNNSASTQNFRTMQGLFGSSLVMDATRTLKDDQGYIDVPKLVAGHGPQYNQVAQSLDPLEKERSRNEPAYESQWPQSPSVDQSKLNPTIDKIMADPNNQDSRELYESLPRFSSTHRVAAKLRMAVAQYNEDYAGSAEEIIDRFKGGEFEFDELLQLLAERAEFIKAEGEEKDNSLEAGYERAGEWHPDDFGLWLMSAMHTGALTPEQKSHALEVVYQVFGLS